MHGSADDLTAVLEKQLANYAELKDLILEKRKVILANDLKGLAQITRRIETLIASNNNLEIGRMDLVRKIAKALGLPETNLTLARIAGHFEGPDRERLLDLRRRAREAISEIQRQNHINAQLLKYSAELLDSVLRTLVETDSPEPTYGITGKTKKRSASVPLLDQQV